VGVPERETPNATQSFSRSTISHLPPADPERKTPNATQSFSRSTISYCKGKADKGRGKGLGRRDGDAQANGEIGLCNPTGEAVVAGGAPMFENLFNKNSGWMVGMKLQNGDETTDFDRYHNHRLWKKSTYIIHLAYYPNLTITKNSAGELKNL
jgi:hypothetical protein